MRKYEVLLDRLSRLENKCCCKQILQGVGVPTEAPTNSTGIYYLDTDTNILYHWNGIVWTEITAGAGNEIFIPTAPTATFETRLNQAITDASAGDSLIVIGNDDVSITSTVNLNKKLTLTFPSITVTYTGTGDMFDFLVDGITLQGTGRSPKASDRADVTVFLMTSGRYHVHGRGVNQPTLIGFDAEGVESGNFETFGNHAGSGDLSGSGGIYFEKPNPGTTSGGNTVSGLYIKDVYIEKTYAHGIYIDTPILAKIENCRTSSVRGFGFYQNGGTSTIFERCFSASAYQGGFLFQSTAYSSMIDCASEAAGVGYWLRSVQGFSSFSCGAESCKNIGTAVPGVLLETLADDDITPVVINDMSSDFESDLRGTSWLISGGQGINLNAPYSTNIDQVYDSGTTVNSRHFLVKGNTRGLSIFNPRVDINSGDPINYRFDWEFDQLGADSPSDVFITYDPNDGTIVPAIGSWFTSVNSAGTSTFVRTDTDDIVFKAGNETFSPYYQDYNEYYTLTAGENIATGELCRLDSSGNVLRADADAEASSIGLLLIATEAINNTEEGKFLVRGVYRTSGLTVGATYYIDTTVGAITTTAPSLTGDIVRVIGYAISATELHFNPDSTYVEIA